MLKLNRIAKNPISVKNEHLEKVDSRNTNETILIENSILKIGSLLMVVFGPGGGPIIANNLESQSGDPDPFQSGKRVYGVYGFCDIRNFTNATEILEEDVMLFVNEIAEVVHSITDRFAGANNKNVGDAFLLIWKIPEGRVQEEFKDGISVLRIVQS